jgi:hypothetical protein
MSSNILSSPFSSPSDTFTITMLVYLMLSHTSLRLCSLFFHYFPFCFLDRIISIVLSLSLLICPNLTLNPSSKFLISANILLSDSEAD